MSQCGLFTVNNNLFSFGFGDGTQRIVKKIPWTDNSFATDPGRFVQMRGSVRHTGEVQIRGTLDPARKQLVSFVARIWRMTECCASDPRPFSSTKTESVQELELGPVPLSERELVRATARHRGGELTAAIRKASVTERSWTGDKLERDVTTTQGQCARAPVLHLTLEPVAPANVIP